MLQFLCSSVNLAQRGVGVKSYQGSKSSCFYLRFLQILYGSLHCIGVPYFRNPHPYQGSEQEPTKTRRQVLA